MMNKLRKTAAFLLILALMISMLPAEVKAEEEYGEDAYRYLQYIDANLGFRITDLTVTTDTTAKNAAGAWIRSQLESFGYQVSTIVQYHDGNEIIDYRVVKPGRSNKRLVIGCHYDSVATKGVEDNGTGISVNLELAKRFANEDTGLTLEFLFFDGEETQGFAGSYFYLVMNEDISSIYCYINIDCVGAGDRLYAYGGAYENGSLVRAWPFYMAKDAAWLNGIDLYTIPEGFDEYPSPTRTATSDHYYFNQNGIPYVYFDTNAWLNSDGVPGSKGRVHFYNSDLEAFSSTNGQIIHMVQWEDLATLESIVPGRIKTHMGQTSQIITTMIREMNTASAETFAWPISHPVETTEAETETVVETTEETETEKKTAEETESEGTEVSETEEETEVSESEEELTETEEPSTESLTEAGTSQAATETTLEETTTAGTTAEAPSVIVETVEEIDASGREYWTEDTEKLLIMILAGTAVLLSGAVILLSIRKNRG